MAWCGECDQPVRWVVMATGRHMAVNPGMVDFIIAGGKTANENTMTDGLVCVEKRHDERQYRGGFIATPDRTLKARWRLFRPHIHTCPNATQIREKAKQ